MILISSKYAFEEGILNALKKPNQEDEEESVQIKIRKQTGTNKKI